MKKIGIILIVFLIFPIVLAVLVSAEIRINEVELNPSGDDKGLEWVELYSNELMDLNGWKLVNNDDEIKNLNQTFQNYLIINFNEQWLDNENESIRLVNKNDSLIFQTPILKDAFNDNKSWSYCNGSWSLVSATPDSANNCPGSVENKSENKIASIYLELEFDYDVKNGDEFDVTIRAYNLENKEYDISAYVYDDNENSPISEAYDDYNDKWVSSKYYIDSFFSGPGNKTDELRLRIKESQRDFYGEARLGVKIRETGGSSYKVKTSEDIDISEADEDSEEETSTSSVNNAKEKVINEVETQNTVKSENVIYLKSSTSSKKAESKATGSMVRLGENLKSNKNIIYESKNEKIRKYSIYSFILLVFVLIILFAFRRL